MLDVAIAYNRFKFIGNEFLTWLWFIIDEEPNTIRIIDDSSTSLIVGNRIVLENNINDTVEQITIKGDDAGLEEGLLSLRKGAVVVEMNISYLSDNQQWTFSLKGESLSFSGLKAPDTGPMENKEDIEGMVLEKVYLYEKAINLLNGLFNTFLALRCTQQWKQKVIPEMRRWILE